MKLTDFFPVFLVITTLFSSSSNASEQPFDVTSLSHNTYWLKLGHYLKSYSGQYVSTIDSKRFFFSSNGQSNPEKELIASIHAFYHGTKEKKRLARCTFPARYSWLELKKGRTHTTLNCPELTKWRKTIKPNKLTLVFPTAFMNNPSSMFGHTFIRIDTKNQNKNNELVAFAINFAAEPDPNDNAALYAIKGLIGSYPGRFTVMPYYKKVREYNDIESRDIWEYPLNFSTKEVNKILLHLWELEQAKFDYYFLDENCSYQLLALLQLANQHLNLVDNFPLTAIPSDTVKSLVSAGLTKPPKYRAAFGTRLLHESDIVDERIYQATKKLKQHAIYPSKKEFTDSERAAILEFAYEWLNFDLYNNELERNTTAKKLTKILISRSKIDAPSPFPSVNKPETSPDQGHGSARVGLSRNIHHINANSTSLEWRTSYHDLYDRQSGFIPGAQISFLDTELSLDDRNNSKLEHLYLIDTMALAPSNRVFDSLAWNINIGFDRPDSTNKGRMFSKGGVGKSWGRADKLHVYWLFEAELNHGKLTKYNLTSGIGAQSGLLYSLSDNNRIGLEAEWISLFNTDTDYHSSIKGTWNWGMTTNTALRTEVRYDYWHNEEISTQITAYLYY